MKLQSECGTLYKVVAGDGCWGIAENAHITQAQLAALNPSLDCATMAVGDGLCLGLSCGGTYVVQPGDWCAKIQDEQKVSEEDLLSLNPGLSCAEVFAGQHLCIAAPVIEPPTDPSTEPPVIEQPPPDPVPVIECAYQIPVAVGDTCYDLATSYGLQLSQFLAMNENLNCDNLQAGNVACMQPACGHIYKVCHCVVLCVTSAKRTMSLVKVQQGDWCAKIETDFTLPAGELVKLNIGLDCGALSPDQALCVQHAPEVEEESQELVLMKQDAYPVYAPAETVPQSPIGSFINAPDPRDTFMGDVLFQGGSFVSIL